MALSERDFHERFPRSAGLPGSRRLGPVAHHHRSMKELWQGQYENFCRRSLAGKRYVYLWADGIYFNIRLTDDRPCVLELMGALEDGTKELIAMIDGQRESEQSWLELLLDAKSRGLTESPRLATGDGALGFWKALKQVYPGTRTQRCWVHKTVNVLDKLARGQQVSGKKMLHEIWMAARKEDALKALGQFAATYQAKFPKAVECLLKDQEELLAFYDFPAEHWQHLRTSNPIESTFATVRLRTYKTKGAGSRTACLAMAFKLVESAQNHWRKLNGSALAGGDRRSDLQRWNEARRLKLSWPSTTFGNIPKCFFGYCRRRFRIPLTHGRSLQKLPADRQ